MNRISVNARDLPLPNWSGALSDYAVKVLEALKHENWDLSILLCTDRFIKDLNSQYRGRKEATDVLSFELGTEVQEEGGVRYLPGDIVISLDTLRENSRYFQTCEDEELRRLLIHGILHLDGMNHLTNDETEPMIVLQEEVLQNLGRENILPQISERG